MAKPLWRRLAIEVVDNQEAKLDDMHILDVLPP